MENVYLLLGSNLGDRIAHLAAARSAIESKVGKITQASHLYESAAWGETAQDDFLNQALEVATNLSPQAVLSTVLSIEDSLGRVRTEKWGPRTIDIDILLFGQQVIDTPTLTVPHKHLTERNFALVPLMEVAGETEHPVLKTTIEDLYFECNDAIEVVRIDD